MVGRMPASRPTSRPALLFTAAARARNLHAPDPPVRVLGSRVFASKSEALKAEAALKKLDRTQRLAWAQAQTQAGGPDGDL